MAKKQSRKRLTKFASVATSLALVASFALAGCSGGTTSASDDEIDYSDWDAVVEAARGTTVTYYGYDGNEELNTWVNELAETVLEKYDITLNYIYDSSALTALSDSLAAGSTENNGAFDIAWVNGSTFKDNQELGGWFGPIDELLPNFETYIDTENPLVYIDFAYDNEGYEVPFGFYELNIIKDDALAPGDLSSPEDFLELAKQYPGKFTYPSSENWVGAAFIRTIIYNTCENYEDLMTVDPDDTDAIKEIIQPALDYLIELNPYLWNEGQTFPADNDEMTQLYSNGEIYNDVLYDQYGCGAKINSGVYSETSQSYIFENTTANFSYWAIPYNSPNKAGALVVINEMLSVEQQADKSSHAAGDVLNHDVLTEEEQALFDDIDHGPNNVSDEELQAAATSEYSADVEAAITEIWLEEVVGS